MSKVYVIGHFEGYIETIRVAANIPTDAEVICVSSVEEIPIEERARQGLKQVGIHQLTLHNEELLPNPISWEKPYKKIKGHERPYKFHR